MNLALSLGLKARKVVSLCSKTGGWGRHYAAAGARVITVDTQEPADGTMYPGREHLQRDLRLLRPDFFGTDVDVLLLEPPCTYFANSGARWPRTDAQMVEALSIVDACLRFVAVLSPRTWALENPVGKLRGYLGPPRLYFNPCDYGDPYTKKTCIWGQFVAPLKRPVTPTEGSKMHRMAPGPERANLRSVTPPGWAMAFWEANQ